MRICPLCGEWHRELPAISRADDKTEICSGCGIREAVGGVLSEEQIEELIKRNKELYAEANGCG